MNNQIVIDLSGINNKDQLLHKLGDIFEFGGKTGNFPASHESKAGWGMNWDALNDSLDYLATGGIWGTSKKLRFPLKVVFENSDKLQESDKKSFEILKEIFEGHSNKYKAENTEFIVEFR